GRIDVKTSPGNGSIFTLFLPEALSAREHAIPSYPPPVETAESEVGSFPEGPILSSDSIKDDGPVRELDGSTVLIVDDDVRSVFALTAALGMHGITVVYAETGADGIARLTEREDIDIVLMDAMMPDMDGNETTVAIRRIPR